VTAKNLKLVCMVLIIVSHGSAGLAQNGEQERSYTDCYRPVPPLPPDLAFTNHHASTSLEGAIRGQAQLIRASGNFWLSLSQAMICHEQARAFVLDNKERWLEHSIALRKWYEFDHQRRNSIQRQANDARRTDRNAIHRLTNDHLDRFTGAIAWPTILEAAVYNDLRERLNELFRARAKYGDTSGENA
jgi:hypothetical protein